MDLRSGRGQRSVVVYLTLELTLEHPYRVRRREL